MLMVCWWMGPRGPLGLPHAPSLSPMVSCSIFQLGGPVCTSHCCVEGCMQPVGSSLGNLCKGGQDACRVGLPGQVPTCLQEVCPAGICFIWDIFILCSEVGVGQLGSGATLPWYMETQSQG
jgi:hypothetical protein